MIRRIGPGTDRIAALVRSNAAVALSGKAGNDGVPNGIQLRKAVQQHNNGSIGWPRIADIENQLTAPKPLHRLRMSNAP